MTESNVVQFAPIASKPKLDKAQLARLVGDLNSVVQDLEQLVGARVAAADTAPSEYVAPPWDAA